MRLLVVGDTHGNFTFACKMVRVAKKYDIRQIVQVGDFAFWDNNDRERRELDTLSDNSISRGVEWLVVPGNHENYDKLEEYEEFEYRTAEGFSEIRPNIYYAGKVSMWKWAGKTFKGVGGAISIDREFRTPHKSWWPQESLKDDERQLAIDMGEADYLFTHDCPTHAPFNHRLKPDLDSVYHRQIMNDVGRATKAKVWIHGHMHEFYDYYFGDTKVYGLECDDNAMGYVQYFGENPRREFKNCAILHVNTGQVEFPDTVGV